MRCALLLLAAPSCIGYLLVALPQSSSTSCMEELGRTSGLPATQVFPCKFKPLPRFHRNNSFWALNNHGNNCDLPSDMLRLWATSTEAVHKQHVPPTVSNLQALLSAGARVVVLVRDPETSLVSYCRRMREEQEGFNVRMSTHPDMVRTELAGRWRALKTWVDTWAGFAATHWKLFKLISFEEMVESSRENVEADALDWLGARKKHKYSESKERVVHGVSSMSRVPVDIQSATDASSCFCSERYLRGVCRND